MTATAQTVRNVDLADTLSGVSNDRIDCIIADEVPCYVNEAQWAECADLAQALVAAHIITIALMGSTAPGGAVTSEAAGGLSRSYATSSPSSDQSAFWQSTSFGSRFWQLHQTRCTTPLVLVASGVL